MSRTPPRNRADRRDAPIRAYVRGGKKPINKREVKYSSVVPGPSANMFLMLSKFIVLVSLLASSI